MDGFLEDLLQCKHSVPAFSASSKHMVLGAALASKKVISLQQLRLLPGWHKPLPAPKLLTLPGQPGIFLLHHER